MDGLSRHHDEDGDDPEQHDERWNSGHKDVMGIEDHPAVWRLGSGYGPLSDRSALLSSRSVNARYGNGCYVTRQTRQRWAEAELAPNSM